MKNKKIMLVLILGTVIIVFTLVKPYFAKAGTSTYTFSGITDPSSTHIAYGYGDEEANPPNDITNGSELTTGQYSTITTINDDDVSHSTRDSNTYALHRFQFKISEDVGTITNIKATWRGFGAWGDDGEGQENSFGANLHIYNFTTLHHREHLLVVCGRYY